MKNIDSIIEEILKDILKADLEGLESAVFNIIVKQAKENNLSTYEVWKKHPARFVLETLKDGRRTLVDSLLALGHMKIK